MLGYLFVPLRWKSPELKRNLRHIAIGTVVVDIRAV